MVIKIIQICLLHLLLQDLFVIRYQNIFYNSSYISSLAGINLVDDANWRAEAGGILLNLIDFKIALSLNRV